MRWGQITDTDSFFRQSIFPESFRGKKGIFATSKCFYLKVNSEKNLLFGSLAWQRFVPTSDDVHAYGCRIAAIRNNRKQLNHATTDAHRSVYCGAYHITAKNVRALSKLDGLSEVFRADVVHKPENGELAHADLRIWLQPSRVVNIESTKTAIVHSLWSQCSGPLKHVCECDRDMESHPSLRLDDSNLGAYVDTRSHFTQWWSVFRFHVYNWIWFKFFRNKNLET
jgi:hypothetical protein